MTKAEVGAFRKKFGYGPTPIATGVDMIAIYVHKDNPIRDLTLAQLAAIFGGPARAAARRPSRRGARTGVSSSVTRRVTGSPVRARGGSSG